MKNQSNVNVLESPPRHKENQASSVFYQGHGYYFMDSEG